MLRKGLSPTLIGMVALTVLGGSMVGMVTQKTTTVADNRMEDVEGELGQFHRSITLSNYSRVAAYQLRSTTNLVTLRSVHCKVLVNALKGGVGETGDSSNVGTSADDNLNIDLLKWAFTLEEPSVRKLKCRASESVFEVTGVNDALGKAEKTAEFANKLRKNPAEVAGSFMLDAAKDGFMTLARLPPWAPDSPSSNKENCYICGDPVNDQPGKYGNIKFTYPSEAENPLVIDSSGNVGSEELGNPRENFPFRPHVRVPVRGDGYGAPEGKEMQADNWNAPSGEIGNSEDDDEDPLEPFWGSGKISFAPDPMLGAYADKGLSDDEIDNSCRDYPVLPFRPAMVNVPVIMEKPLYAKFKGDLTITGEGNSVSFSEGDHLELLESLGRLHNCRDRERMFLNTYMREGEVVGFDEAFAPPDHWREDADIVTQHKDYEFVICPGSEGRIQSNAGLPYNSESATHAGKWSGVKSPSDGGGMAGENVVYPFIELENMRSGCVEAYEQSSGDWEDHEWAGFPDLEQETLDKVSEALEQKDCDDYVDLKKNRSVSTYSLSKEKLDFTQYGDGGENLDLFQVKCGLQGMSGYGKKYWKFEKFARNISAEVGVLNFLYDYRDYAVKNEEEYGSQSIQDFSSEVGRLNAPESVKIGLCETEVGSNVKYNVTCFKDSDQLLYPLYDVLDLPEEVELEFSRDDGERVYDYMGISAGSASTHLKGINCNGRNYIRGGDYYNITTTVGEPIEDHGTMIKCLSDEKISELREEAEEGITDFTEDIVTPSGESKTLELPDGVSLKLCDAGYGLCYGDGDRVEVSDVSVSSAYINIDCNGDEVLTDGDEYTVEKETGRISEVDITCEGS